MKRFRAAINFLYVKALKPVLFLFDPEDIHDLFTAIGALLGRCVVTRALTRWAFAYRNPRLEQEILGIRFANPIGLAAGFDKNGLMTDIMPAVGFGFTEVGSVTGEPCQGNPRPRLWRLPKSQSLGVWYGLKNDGCEVVAKRLAKRRTDGVVGASVAMTNCAENANLQHGVGDYAQAYAALAPVADYLTVNISCPNAYGGQPFTAADRLEVLLARLDQIPSAKPVFLKMSPDLSDAEVDAIVLVAGRHRVHGFICTNLTKKQGNPHVKDPLPPHGGLSGKVVDELSDRLIARLYRQTKGKYVIIGCGGVFSAEDAWRKITLGASLIELITGMIFEGPQLIGEINRGLVELMDRHGYKDIREVIGSANK